MPPLCCVHVWSFQLPKNHMEMWSSNALCRRRKRGSFLVVCVSCLRGVINEPHSTSMQRPFIFVSVLPVFYVRVWTCLCFWGVAGEKSCLYVFPWAWTCFACCICLCPRSPPSLPPGPCASPQYSSYTSLASISAHFYISQPPKNIVAYPSYLFPIR